MKKTIEVAVGLVFNNQREILLAWRAAHKIPGNCWEFPGGKREAGETSYQALCRELTEEVGITVNQAVELPSVYHQYEEIDVMLHPWRVSQYQGVPRGIEGQQIAWVAVQQLRQLTLPAANQIIVDLLLLEENALFTG